jgi:hypothetical protein
MGTSHRQLSHIDRVNEIGTRASNLRELTAKLENQHAHPNAAKAHRVVEHAIGHIHDAYSNGCVSNSDRDHYLGLAEICLDHAEQLLNEVESAADQKNNN